jgi:hypothetical protein
VKPRLLLVLQFFPGDRALAMELAKLWADLEPRPNKNVEVLLAARFDTKADSRVAAYLSRKFQVHTFVGRRRAQGWPFGCNELWHDIAAYVYERIVAKLWPPFDVMLTTEADSVPLVPGWTDKLLAEWDRRGVCVMGHLTTQYIVWHVNGNAMFSCKEPFLRAVIHEGGCDARVGWDVAMTKTFQRWGQADSVVIRSFWRGPPFTHELLDTLLAGGAVFYHGIKTDQGIRTIRERYLPAPIRQRP